MKPNREDFSFVTAVHDESLREKMLARLLTQRLVSFVVGGVHLALLLFDMLSGRSSGHSPVPTVALGLNAALFAAIGFNADAKIKTLITIRELKKEKEPNKAMEATPVAVTPPAIAGAAPSTSVSHL